MCVRYDGVQCACYTWTWATCTGPKKMWCTLGLHSCDCVYVWFAVCRCCSIHTILMINMIRIWRCWIKAVHIVLIVGCAHWCISLHQCTNTSWWVNCTAWVSIVMQISHERADSCDWVSAWYDNITQWWIKKIGVQYDSSSWFWLNNYRLGYQIRLVQLNYSLLCYSKEWSVYNHSLRYYIKEWLWCNHSLWYYSKEWLCCKHSLL